MALDIQRAPGQDLVRRLLARADVFLESTSPGTLTPLGLDHRAVAGVVHHLLQGANRVTEEEEENADKLAGGKS